MRENASGDIECECSSCRRGGTILGWRGSFSDLSEICDDDTPCFEVAVTEGEYDHLKKCLAAEPEADLVVLGATYSDGLVLCASADLLAFTELLESNVAVMKKTKGREALDRVLKSTKVVLGHWHPG